MNKSPKKVFYINSALLMVAILLVVNMAVPGSREFIKRAWAAVGAITGEGTINKLVRFAGAQTPSNFIADSIIYDNGTNIGIGTATPGVKLDVSGEIRSRSGVLSIHDGTTLGGGLYFHKAITGAGTNLSPVLFAEGAGGDLYFMTGGSATTKMFIRDDGNVGIGNSNPGYKLDVTGTVNATGYLLNGAALSTSQWTTSASNIYYNTGSVGIGTASPGGKLDVISGSATDGYWLNGRPAVTSNDGWLRLNQTGAFTNGVYSPGLIRADGGLQFYGNITSNTIKGGLVGTYDAANTQQIFAMGPAYILPVGGSSTNYGSFYGIAWSYNPDYGGAGNNPQSKAGLNHQALFMLNGVTQTAIGTGIWTNGNITTTGRIYASGGIEAGVTPITASCSAGVTCTATCPAGKKIVYGMTADWYATCYYGPNYCSGYCTPGASSCSVVGLGGGGGGSIYAVCQ